MSTRGWKHVIRVGRLLYPLSHLTGPIFQFLKDLLGLCLFLRLSISPGVVSMVLSIHITFHKESTRFKGLSKHVIFPGLTFDLCSYYFRLLFLECYKLLLTLGSWSILLVKPVPLPHTNSAGIMANSETQASESDVFSLSVWHSPALFVCSVCQLSTVVTSLCHVDPLLFKLHWNRICLSMASAFCKYLLYERMKSWIKASERTLIGRPILILLLRTIFVPVYFSYLQSNISIENGNQSWRWRPVMQTTWGVWTKRISCSGSTWTI